MCQTDLKRSIRKKYDYKNEAERNIAIEKQKGEHSTSVFSKMAIKQQPTYIQ